MCNGQYSTGGQLARNVCCTAEHAPVRRCTVLGVATNRLKSTADMGNVADRMPGKEHVRLAGQPFLSGPAANAAGSHTSVMSTAAATAAVFPGKHKTRPTVGASASKAVGGASFRSYTIASVSVYAKRCFATGSKDSDDDGDTESSIGNAGAGKTAPTRRKAPVKKVPKARKEAFKHARKAGVIERLIKGGGVPRDSSSSDGDTLPLGREGGSREGLTHIFNEKDYPVGGEVPGLPTVTAVRETITSKEFVAGGAEAKGKGEGEGGGEGEGVGEGEEEEEREWKSNSAHVTGHEVRRILKY